MPPSRILQTKHVHDAFLEAKRVWRQELGQTDLLSTHVLAREGFKIKKSVLPHVVRGARLEHALYTIGWFAKVLQEKLTERFDRNPEEIRALYKSVLPNFSVRLIGMCCGESDSEQKLETVKIKEEVSQNIDSISKYLHSLPGFSPIRTEVKSEMRRLLSEMKKRGSGRPLVFYHWRQMHSAIHWVDFFFLRVLAEMQRYGFEAQALMSERYSSVDPITAAVKKILHRPPITDAGAQSKKEFYERYVLDNTTSKARDKILKDRNIESTMWLQFIPYYAEASGRPGFIQLIWKKRAKEYRSIHSIDGAPRIVQIRTPDILIGGVNAKKLGPELCIEPSPYPTFRSWLSCVNPRPTFQQAAELLEYFRALDSHLSEHNLNATSLQRDWVSLLGKNPNKNLCSKVEQLATIVANWERRYLELKKTYATDD